MSDGYERAGNATDRREPAFISNERMTGGAGGGDSGIIVCDRFKEANDTCGLLHPVWRIAWLTVQDHAGIRRLALRPEKIY